MLSPSNPLSTLQGWLGRLSRAAAGAMLAGGVAAAVDALWARAAVEGSRAPDLGPLALASYGLVAPAALGVGVGVAAFTIFLEPGAMRSPRALVRGLRGEGAGRATLASFAPLVGPALALWMTATAQLSRAIMAQVPGAPRAGVVVAFGAIALALATAAMVLAAQPLVRRALGDAAEERDPVSLGTAGLAAGAALLALGIASGSTGGDGGVLGIWGVLKRPELDLRAVGLLSVVALGSWAGLHALARLPGPAAALLAVLPFALTVRDASALAREPDTTLALERGAPLSKLGLAALRKLTDRDKDGASAYFGGGDCNDRDPNVGPTAIDVPGNGIDEDCSGADAIPPKEPPAAAPVVAASSVDRISPNLNVVFITVDTLRADLGYAGNPKPLSPNLDALAAKSVVFDRAYSLASYTGKSIGPLMSGKYPSETHRGWSHFNSFGKDDVMVAERLKKSGVRTLGMMAHWYFGTFTGLARGMDVWDMSAQPGGGLQEDNDTTVTGDKLTAAAMRLLSKPENTSGRFFAWLHYVDPHADYLRHEGAPDLGTGGRALYDGEVWFVDREIGRLLEFIAAQPWGKDTAVVVTSDHGEAFGEHHMLRHGFEIWEELVRVPLVFYVPGAPPHHVKERRSCVDVVPTLLDLFHAPQPAGATKHDFVSGQSLVDDLFLPKGYEPPVRDVFVDMPAGPNNDEKRGFYHGDKKLYVSNGSHYQLFDLAADPGEKDDRYRDDKASADEMVAAYQAFKARLREVYIKPVAKE